MRTRKSSAKRVVTILIDHGYVLMPQPLIVGGLAFEGIPFLVRANSKDLVIVASRQPEPENGWVREIDAVARALDAIESTRSLTTVTFDATVDVILSLREVSRVLPLTRPDFDNEAILERRLAILLPLILPEAIGPSHITLEVEEVVSSELAGGPLQQLVQASQGGASAVETAMIALFKSAWAKQ